MLIGAISGVLVCVAVFFIEGTLKVDDPVGAISVHGVNGAWGVLSLGLFADGKYGDGWNGVPGTVTGLFYGDASQFFGPVRRHADLHRLRLRQLLRVLQGGGRDHRQPRFGRSRARRASTCPRWARSPIPSSQIVRRAHTGAPARRRRQWKRATKPAARRGHGAPPRCPVNEPWSESIMTRTSSSVETPSPSVVSALRRSSPRPARAQAPAPTPEPTPAPAPARRSTSPASSTSTTATTSTRSIPLLRTFDVQHNAFSLSLAEVAFTKAVTPESKVGFRVDLDFGKTADLVGGLRAGERRQGDLQAHPAGLRAACSRARCSGTSASS